MTIYSAIGFALAMIVLAASPGPGVFAIIARALASGFKDAFVVILGLVLGDIIFLAFAIFGLSMVAKIMGNLFIIVKICGGIYLIFLGLKIWLKKPDDMTMGHNSKAHFGNFLSGLIVTLSNPKVIIFYCGFLPTFLDLSALTVTDFIVIMGIVIVVLISVLSVYAFLASRTRQLFTNQKIYQRFNRAAGGVMIATGVAIATR